MAATDSRDVTFKLVYFRFAIFFPLMRSPKSKVRFVECGRISAKAQRRSITVDFDDGFGKGPPAGASCGRLCPTPPVTIRFAYLPVNFLA